MAKLTRAQTHTVAEAYRHANRALAYLQQSNIVVARAGGVATTTLHYVRQSDGATLYPVAKDIGSDLAGLQDCIRLLRCLGGES